MNNYLKIYSTNPSFIPTSEQEEKIINFLNETFEELGDIDCNSYSMPYPIFDDSEIKAYFIVEINFFEKIQLFTDKQLQLLTKSIGENFQQYLIEEE